jgi:hypothetical protein
LLSLSKLLLTLEHKIYGENNSCAGAILSAYINKLHYGAFPIQE